MTDKIAEKAGVPKTPIFRLKDRAEELLWISETSKKPMKFIKTQAFVEAQRAAGAEPKPLETDAPF